MTITRRQFGTAMAALGLEAASGGQQPIHAEAIQLSRNGWMPNNDRLPILLYRRAFDPHGKDVADTMEQAFTRNQWPPQWRNGVYSFHHYHSTTHEVLGFAAGSADLMLGGENGHALTVNAGDVVALPTGTGHCRLKASTDFLVIGAYPPGQHWDICRAAPDASAQERMRSMPFPQSDPITGAQGDLVRNWHPHLNP